MSRSRPHSEITIPLAASLRLNGLLTVPAAAHGLVVFVHGSGSSRLSPRNREVAATLNQHGVATLLMDLLTPAEEAEDELTARLRFDIPMLARRVVDTVDWLDTQTAQKREPLGLFGASTGAAAALITAAERTDRIKAVVSRGGRPDLAGDALEDVQAPTLLIVGSRDPQVLELNRLALARLRGEAHLHIVPGATHLFEEPGTLAEVADQAAGWFTRHF
jgi:dienelactone hydrolase